MKKLLATFCVAYGTVFSFAFTYNETLYLYAPSNNSQNTFAPPSAHSSTSHHVYQKNYNDCLFIQTRTAQEIYDLCRNKKPRDLFQDYSHYANPYYYSYIRTLPGYEDYVLELFNAYTHCHKQRKELRPIKGFLHDGEFLKLIDSEVIRIKVEREQRALRAQQEERHRQETEKQVAEAKRKAEQDLEASKQEALRKQQELKQHRLKVHDYYALESLHKKSMQRSIDACKANNQEQVARNKKRVAAIEKTRKNPDNVFDYSAHVSHYPSHSSPDTEIFKHCYGTHIDQQLHEELCDTRATMLKLQLDYAGNVYTKSYAPLVYSITTHAKKEQCVEKAFNLSDFSHDLVRIVKHGIDILASEISRDAHNFEIGMTDIAPVLKKGATRAVRGISSGAQKVLTSQHWIDMAEGVARFTVFLADEHAHSESLDAALFSGNADLLLERSKDYEQHHRAQAERLRKSFSVVKQMSWGDLGEGAFHHGTTLLLDGVAFAAGGLVVNSAGRAFVNTVADALGSTAAKEYVVEVAGVGKLVVEEGAEIAQEIKNTFTKSNNASPEYFINLANKKRTQHILYGDKTGGGHLWPGKLGKSAFPESWNADKIMHYVSDVATEPNIKPIWTRGVEGSLFTKSGIPSRYYVDGVKEGVRIRVVVEPSNGEIITAFPVY